MIFYIGRLWVVILLLIFAIQAVPSNAKSAISEASKAGQFLFLIFYSEKDAAFNTMLSNIEAFRKTISPKTSIFKALTTNPVENDVVTQYGVQRARLPLALVFAPNGAITGGYEQTVTIDQLKKSVTVSDLMLKTLKPLQDQKVVLVSLQNASTKFNAETKKAANDFASDPQFKQMVSVVNADPTASGSGEFIKQCQIPEKPAEATIVVLLPPGRIGGVLKGNLAISKSTILGVLQSCGPGGGGGCCPKK